MPLFSDHVQYFESKSSLKTSKLDVEQFKTIWKENISKVVKSGSIKYVDITPDFREYAVSLYCKFYNEKYNKPGLAIGTNLSDIISCLPSEFYQFNLIVFESGQGPFHPC